MAARLELAAQSIQAARAPEDSSVADPWEKLGVTTRAAEPPILAALVLRPAVRMREAAHRAQATPLVREELQSLQRAEAQAATTRRKSQ